MGTYVSDIPDGFIEITLSQRAQGYMNHSFKDVDLNLYRENLRESLLRLKIAEESAGLPIQTTHGVTGLPRRLFFDSLRFKPRTIKAKYGLTNEDLSFVRAKFGIKFHDYAERLPHADYCNHMLNDLNSPDYTGRARESLERLQEIEKILGFPRTLSFGLMGLPAYLVQVKNFQGYKFKTLRREYSLQDDDFLFLSAKYGIVWAEHDSFFVPVFYETMEMFYPRVGWAERRAQEMSNHNNQIKIKKRGVPWTPERRKEQSKIMKEKWANPLYANEKRRKHSEIMKEKWANPDFAFERSQRIRESLTPEIRAKQSESLRAYWARKKSLELKAAE